MTAGRVRVLSIVTFGFSHSTLRASRAFSLRDRCGFLPAGLLSLPFTGSSAH